MTSCSPHTTSCLYSPRRSGPVRKPSLPATNSRQSRAISCTIAPAVSVWCGFIPNVMHFPNLCLISDSHRGLNEAVAASPGALKASGLDAVDFWRVCRAHASSLAYWNEYLLMRRGAARMALLFIAAAVYVDQLQQLHPCYLGHNAQIGGPHGQYELLESTAEDARLVLSCPEYIAKSGSASARKWSAKARRGREGASQSVTSASWASMQCR